MDKLDIEIDAKRKELDALKAQLSALEAELAIYKRAAALRPIQATESAQKQLLSTEEKIKKHGPILDSAIKRGKPTGSINKDWRTALGDLYPDRFTFERFAKAASACGITTSESGLKDRLRSFMSHNFIIGDEHAGYIVTEEAAARFGLTK